MIIFTPKSLLRHPRVVSPLEDLTKGGFREVIDDPDADPEKVRKVVFVSGKLYYELIEHKEKINATNTAIIRLEQIYPLPATQLEQIINKYPKTKDWVWGQEEPGNMGAWQFIQRNLNAVKLRPVMRPDSGSPATGSSKFHKIRQDKLIQKVFGECDCEHVEEECRMICAQEEKLLEKERNGEI